MSTTYPSNLSDAEWDRVQQLLPRKNHHMAGSVATPSALFSMPSFMCCVRAAPGATCPTISHLDIQDGILEEQCVSLKNIMPSMASA